MAVTLAIFPTCPFKASVEESVPCFIFPENVLSLLCFLHCPLSLLLSPSAGLFSLSGHGGISHTLCVKRGQTLSSAGGARALSLSAGVPDKSPLKLIVKTNKQNGRLRAVCCSSRYLDLICDVYKRRAKHKYSVNVRVGCKRATVGWDIQINGSEYC